MKANLYIKYGKSLKLVKKLTLPDNTYTWKIPLNKPIQVMSINENLPQVNITENILEFTRVQDDKILDEVMFIYEKKWKK